MENIYFYRTKLSKKTGQETGPWRKNYNKKDFLQPISSRHSINKTPRKRINTPCIWRNKPIQNLSINIQEKNLSNQHINMCYFPSSTISTSTTSFSMAVTRSVIPHIWHSII